MFKLRNISLSNLIFKKNNLIDISKYLSTHKLTAFAFSTNNDANKNKNTQNTQANKKSDEPASPVKRVIVMKKAENTGSSQNKQQQQQQKGVQENQPKQAQVSKAPSTMKKQPEPKQALPEKAPVVMRKKEEAQKPKQRAEGVSKDLPYKEIIKSQTSENYQFLFNNAAIVKLMREYSNLYSDSLEKKYNKILKEIIREKVFSIESEIKSMKEIREKMKNTKINFDEFKLNYNSYNNEQQNKINEKSEFKNIFDLSKNSIKEIKEKIKALPPNKTESLRFNVEYSDFYLNVDIDKSFEIFRENILNKTVTSDLKATVEEFSEHFLLRIYELDRLIYLPDLLKFIESSSLSISASAKLLKQIETNSQNHSSPEGFNYTALLLNLQLLNILLNQKTNQTNSLALTAKAATEIFENCISQITSFKLTNKIIHKEIQDDEILSLSSLLGSALSSASQKSAESLHKIFALYFDNKDFLPLIYLKFFTTSESTVNNGVYSNENNINNNLQTLKANLEAYVSNFGCLPSGFAEGPAAHFYFKSMRPKLEKQSTEKSATVHGVQAEADFAYFLLKQNKLTELQADLISLLDAKAKSSSGISSDYVKSCYADFILSSSLEPGIFYYEILEKLYSKQQQQQQSEKDFASHLLYETLAYLKDGNADYAVSHMLKSIEKRAEFVKNNDTELLKLLSSLTSAEALNAENATESKQEKKTFVKLDADFIPFLEQIKLYLSDLLAYESAFKTQRNVLLAKENVIDKLFERKSANASLNLNLNTSENVNESVNSNVNLNANVNGKENSFSVAERNYYNEKFNKIIYNLNQIKYLREKKESEHFSSLKSNTFQGNNSIQKQTKSFASALTQANNQNQTSANNNTHLDEMKVYIYSRFEATEKFYFEISKALRMNFNRIEDFENLKFESTEAKQNLLRNLERKIREMSNAARNLSPENKQLLQFYKSFSAYAEQKLLALSSEIILSEDMLNYIENPNFLLKRKIEEADYVAKARERFSGYYSAQAQRRVPRQSLFVLENLDFLKSNLQVDLDNFVMRSFDFDGNGNKDYKDLKTLDAKIQYYERNLEFVKKVIAKVPNCEAIEVNNVNLNNSSKSDLLLKQLVLFECENAAKASSSSNNNSAIIASTENKANHLIEAYLKSFSLRTSKRLFSNSSSSGYVAKKSAYPFKAINAKNLAKFIFTLNSGNSASKSVFNSIAEKVIVPAINSPKIAVCKSVLAQLENLEQAVKGRNYEEDFAVNDLFAEVLKRMNISFNRESGESAEALKLKEMKDVIDQNFEVFDVKHCVNMIQFGVENNIAEAIRLGEKICSDLGYSLPSHIENRVNKYLLTNGENYARASEKIYPVDLARIYNNAKDLSISDSIENVYDEILKATSPYAVDKLPFKGLEKAFDFRKFGNVVRHFNLKY